MEEPNNDYKITQEGGRMERINASRDSKRIVIGSAKSIFSSLYGDGTVPPTPKPLAKLFLKQTKWLVLDEVDRILNVPGRRKSVSKEHEKPAAILTSNIMKYTLSKCQIICASATVGRTLRRELCRILRIPFAECPVVLQPETNLESEQSRAITIPSTIQHYILEIKGTGVGSLLTNAAFSLKSIDQPDTKKILLIVSRDYCHNFPLSNAVNALKHLGVKPEPKYLVDAFDESPNKFDLDSLVHVQQNVSRSKGIGQSFYSEKGYLFVTNEDSIRGLHFSNLDLVVMIGRPQTPDEYSK